MLLRAVIISSLLSLKLSPIKVKLYTYLGAGVVGVVVTVVISVGTVVVIVSVIAGAVVTVGSVYIVVSEGAFTLGVVTLFSFLDTAVVVAGAEFSPVFFPAIFYKKFGDF